MLAKLVANLAALLVVAACVAQANYPKLTIADLCDNKVDRVQSLDQIFQLVPRQAFKQSKSCIKKVTDVNYLIYIVTQNSAARICKPSVGRIYTNLHRERMRLLDPWSLPGSLKAFMADLGYELSAKCKLALLDNIANVDQVLGEQQIKQYRLFQDAAARVFDNVSPAATDLWRVWFELNSVLEAAKLSHLDIQAELGKEQIPLLTDLSKLCHAELIPTHDEMTATLSDLQLLGFDYSLAGPLGDSKLETFNSDLQLRSWLGMMLMCKASRDLSVSWASKKPLFWIGIRLPSPVLPNGLLIDAHTQAVQLGKLSSESSAEAKSIKEDIYQRLTGSKFSALSIASNRAKKLAMALLKFVGTKLGSSGSQTAL